MIEQAISPSRRRMIEDMTIRSPEMKVIAFQCPSGSGIWERRVSRRPCSPRP
jgi:hypothetical protein